MEPLRVPDDSSTIAQEDDPNQIVTQEVPAMRAMALTSLPKLAFETGNHYSLKNRAFGGPLPPLTKAFDQPALSREQSSDDAIKLAQEWDNLSTEVAWDVKGENLKMIPWEFPLERTHREITECASVVARRISNVLRLMSVETEYCSNKVKAKCRTNDFVTFRIRLFAGGENCQPVVVELQRRNGSASSFMRTCRAILDAAEGKDAVEARSSSTRSMPQALKVSVSSMSCLSQVVTAKPDLESDAKEALETALGLFRSNLLDTSLLGLENLCCITDPLKTCPIVAAWISKFLITEGDVRDELRILIERDVFSVEDNEQQGQPMFREAQRLLGLHVFANSISMCFKEGSLTHAISDSWFVECFLPVLVDELNRVETGPHTAFRATVCLHCILSCSPTICQTMKANGVYKTLEKVFIIGQLRHELLACESRSCLDVLNSAR